MGEVFVSHDRVPLYASPEGLGQAFAFDIQKEAYDATAMRKTIDGLYNTARGAGSTTTWVLSNHDVSLFPVSPEGSSYTERDTADLCRLFVTLLGTEYPELRNVRPRPANLCISSTRITPSSCF